MYNLNTPKSDIIADKINSTTNSINFTDIAYGGNFKNDKNSTVKNFKNSTPKIEVKNKFISFLRSL